LKFFLCSWLLFASLVASTLRGCRKRYTFPGRKLGRCRLVILCCRCTFRSRCCRHWDPVGQGFRHLARLLHGSG
jgi:hypothetical protein